MLLGLRGGSIAGLRSGSGRMKEAWVDQDYFYRWMSNQTELFCGKKVVVREVTKNPKITLTELPRTCLVIENAGETGFYGRLDLWKVLEVRTQDIQDIKQPEGLPKALSN